MNTLRTKAALRQVIASWRQRGASIGFVPTMGALHEGHLSLVRAARRENDRVVVSIFVNPTQFNDAADFEAYPRREDRDRSLLDEEGVDLLFAPELEEVYGPGHCTTVQVGGLTDRLEGAHRPGHFDGVATIVTKLFHLTQPTRAYFGAKDAQQVRVIRRLCEDLDFDLQIRECPTVREESGLACSSRNLRLSPDARRRAAGLYAALREGAELLGRGVSPSAVRSTLRRRIEGLGEVRVDYVSIADEATLEELDDAPQGGALLSLAAWIEGVRLIDNITYRPEASS